MDSTKVLMLCKSSALGGMETLVARLAAQLPAWGVSVRLVLPESMRASGAISWCARRGVEAEASSAVSASWHMGVRRLLRLAGVVRRSAADVVNIHSGTANLPMDVLAVVAGGCKRCVVSPHNPSRSRTIFQTVDTRYVSRLCQAIVVGNRALGDLLIDCGVRASKLHFIPIGVPKPAVVPTRDGARRLLCIPSDAFVVACVARLCPEKAVATVIDAVWRIHAPGRAIHLIIAGDGPERASLQARAHECLGQRVHFTGFVEDPSHVYAAADVIALASRVEGAPNVLKEAALFAVPAVAMDVGGVRDVVVDNQTGLLAAVGNPEAFAAHIQRLIDDEESRRRFGKAAELRAQHEFSEPRMIQAYADILRHRPCG